MNKIKQAPWQADVLLLLITVVAAGGWIFSKEALAGMPPLLFIGTRFLLAGLILLGFAWPALRRLPPRQLVRGVLVGFLFSAAIAFWVLGLNYSDHLGESAFINSLGILLVPVVARLLFGDRPPRSTWIALPVALLGFALLSLNAGFKVEVSQFLMICAALCFALLINVNARVVRHVPALPLTTLQLLSVGGVLTSLSFLVEHQPLALSASILGWFMASVLLASSLRFFLQIKAQGMTTPSHAAVILMLEAVWTALFAAWWFGETMTLLQLLGCSLIFTALLINRWFWVRKMLMHWLSNIQS